MTRTLLRLLMLGLLPAGCGGRQTPQHEAAPAAERPAIRATAAATEEPDSCGDTLHCELPQCALLRTDTLLAPADTLLGMRTERTQYPADVRTICALVVNPTDTPLYFGRAWGLLRHEAEGWRRVPVRIPDYAWEADGFRIDRAPLRYHFRFPVGTLYDLTPGRYRLVKRFEHRGRWLELTADFTVTEALHPVHAVGTNGGGRYEPQ